MAINTKGVLVGGLVAGLIINVSESILNVPVLGTQMEAALKARNLPPVGGTAIAFFIIMGFIMGWLLVWLYAAVRPRFGPGPRAAVAVGAIVWLLAYFWSSIAMVLMGFMPAGLTLIALAWGLVELVVASWAGARLYSET
jgi:hypothetical protein